MKKALLGFSVAVVALTGCSKFEPVQSDVSKGDLNAALQGTWVETTCKDSTRKLLDFSKDEAGNGIMTVAVLKFAENDKECVNVEGGTLLAKNTHNLQVSKYKTDYAAGKVKAGDEKEALEAGVKGELLHLGKSVYGRVDRSKFAPLLDQAADVAPGPAAVTPPATPPGEQVPPLKDPKSIVIDELPGEAIVEIEEVYVSPARINADGVEEVTVGSKKMSLEEMLAYDLQQTIDGLKMPTFEFEEEQVSAAK